MDDGDQDAEPIAFSNQLRGQLVPEDGTFDSLAELKSEANAIESSVVETKKSLEEAKTSLDALWADDTENDYELSSVFIHLGAAGYGHYYRKPTQT